MKDTPGKDKLLYILTPQGLLKAFVTPKKMAGKKSFAFDLFTYGEIVYFITDSGNNLINSITPEESFYGIREDIARLYAAGYFASLAIFTCEDAETDTFALMTLVLESFKRLSSGQSVKKIKPVFEFITARLLGISPCLEAELKSNEYYFAIDDGRLFVNPMPNSIYLQRSAVMSVYKILSSSENEAFDVPVQDEDMLYNLSEQYLIYHTERNFDTLKYLNGVI